MVLRGQLRGRVGRCRDILGGPAGNGGPFFFQPAHGTEASRIAGDSQHVAALRLDAF